MTRNTWLLITAVIGLMFTTILLALHINPFPVICYFFGLLIGPLAAPEKQP